MQMLTAGRVPSASDWLLIDVGNTFLKWGRYAAIRRLGHDETPFDSTEKSNTDTNTNTNTNTDNTSITSQVYRTALEHCIVQGRVLLAEIPILAID